MEQKDKLIKLALETMGMIGSVYGFFKSHKEEIKEIVTPLLNSYTDLNK